MGLMGARMAFNTNIKSTLKTKSDVHLARKIWHFLGIVLIAIFYNNFSRQVGLSLSLSLAVSSLLLDFIRLHNERFNAVVIKIMSPIMRDRERNTYTGTTALFFGVFIVVWLFPERIVQMSLLFLATADPIASYFGIKYGKDKIVGEKSLQGALAAFVCCTVISVIFYFNEGLMTERILIVSLLSGLIGSVSELIAVGKLDDNLTYPVINSFLLWFLFRIFGGL